jgi:ComF family protein
MGYLLFGQWLKEVKVHSDALLLLLFPNLCALCGRPLIGREQAVCRICVERLPRTFFHRLPANAVERVFWGRVKIERASALLFYRKGEHAQQILHGIKYKGNRELGNEMGRLLGLDLLSSEWIGQVDVIVPVPLHKRKERMRGYNQSDLICRGLSSVCQVPVSVGNLIRIRETATQTRKGRFERYMNMEGVFFVAEPDKLVGKHVLLVDDVLTTGSTIEACANAILKVSGTRVSVATLAYAAVS